MEFVQVAMLRFDAAGLIESLEEYWTSRGKHAKGERGVRRLPHRLHCLRFDLVDVDTTCPRCLRRKTPPAKSGLDRSALQVSPTEPTDAKTATGLN